MVFLMVNTGQTLFVCRISASADRWVLLTINNKDNNNTNFKTMFMVLSLWQRHCASSSGSFWLNVEWCQVAANLQTKPDDLGCESTCTGCQCLHPPSPFIIITQSESWYLFDRPTEGSRLGRPSWLVTYGRRAFAVAAPATCNTLSDELRNPDLHSATFRCNLKTFLFRQYLAHWAH